MGSRSGGGKRLPDALRHQESVLFRRDGSSVRRSKPVAITLTPRHHVHVVVRNRLPGSNTVVLEGVDPLRSQGSDQCPRNLAGVLNDLTGLRRLQVEERGRMPLRDHQQVSRLHWPGIYKA